MLLSVVSFLVVAQSSSEVLEGLMNNPVYLSFHCGLLSYDLIWSIGSVLSFWGNMLAIS